MRAREFLAPALLAVQSFAAKPPAGSFRILLLHDVPADRYDRLARLLDYVIERHGFIDPHDVFDRHDGPVRYVLNFDDGFMGNRDVAERLLAPRGITAVFFVNPGLIDAQRDKTYMGWDDLAALASAGHVIGSHGLSHQRLAGLRGDELRQQVVLPGEMIASRLGAAPHWFAYPFGDIDSIDADGLAVIGAHYRVCRSGVRGLNEAGVHRLAVLSDHIDLDASFAWQRLTVAGGLDGRYAKARARLHRWAASAASS